jgi:hypothetical protein
MQYWGAVTIAEIEQTSLQAQAQLRQVESRVHVIVDLSQQISTPTNIPQLSRASQPILGQANLGFMVAILHNPLIKFFANIILQLQGNRGKMVATWADAVASLARFDPTLAPLPPEIPTGTDVYYSESTTSHE